MSFFYNQAFITIATAKNEDLVDFYRQLFNLQPNPYIPEIYAEFQLKGLRLGIFQVSPSNYSEFANSLHSTMSICLEVLDLEKAIARLNSLGYPPPGEIITASHGREIYAYDPMGNRLILHQS
ncbi:MAG: VOC family protein, partial [Pleurocapsa sp.]